MSGGTRLSKSAWAWAFYQGVRDPYIILIGTYVFIPYFATVVVGDAVKGQTVVAGYNLISSLIVALSAPLLGAIADQLGSRKGGVLLCTVLSAPLIALLWFAQPLGHGLPVAATVLILIAITLLLSYGDVFYNAMLTGAAHGAEQAEASGMALSLGNAVSIVMLLGVLFAFVLPGVLPWSFLPHAPLFGLDKASHQPDRLSGPLVALVFALGSIPLFLFAKDAPSSGVPLGDAVKRGGGHLMALFKGGRIPKNVWLYLAARMLYVDGKMALLIFGGVYAAGVMHWGVLELLALGVLATFAGVVGGVVGGWLDLAVGPKSAFAIEIVLTLGAVLAQLGTDPHHIVYATLAPHGAALWNGPVFTGQADFAYLLIWFVMSLFGTASWASSRTMMVRLSPPEEAGAYFGLFALSGTLTMWLGPLLVELCTHVFKSQRAGFTPIAVLMTAGLILLCFVKGGRKA